MSAEELRNLVAQLQVDLMETSRQKEEGQGQIKRLQHKLEATENTVRHISRKLKSSRPPLTLRSESAVSACHYIGHPLATRRSLSETSLQRDRWSKMYQGMLHDDVGISSGHSYGDHLNPDMTRYHQGSSGYINLIQPLKYGVRAGKAKSLSKIGNVNDEILHSSDYGQPELPPPNLQRVRVLSSSCILSSQNKHSDAIDKTLPNTFVRQDKNTVGYDENFSNNNNSSSSNNNTSSSNNNSSNNNSIPSEKDTTVSSGHTNNIGSENVKIATSFTPTTTTTTKTHALSLQSFHVTNSNSNPELDDSYRTNGQTYNEQWVNTHRPLASQQLIFPRPNNLNPSAAMDQVNEADQDAIHLTQILHNQHQQFGLASGQAKLINKIDNIGSLPQRDNSVALSNNCNVSDNNKTCLTHHEQGNVEGDSSIISTPRTGKNPKREDVSLVCYTQRHYQDTANYYDRSREPILDGVTNLNSGQQYFFSDFKPETEILTQLQHLLTEKESVWRKKTEDIKQRMKKENVLLMQENELLHEEVKLLREDVQSREKIITEFKLNDEVNGESRKRLEEEIKKLKQEKAEIEEDLVNQDKELIDLDKTLCKLEITKKESDIQKRKKIDELEVNKKELIVLKKELEHYKETNKSLKDSLIKREASLQEQIFTVRKLKAERSIFDTKQTTYSSQNSDVTTKTEVGFQRKHSSFNEKHSRMNDGFGQVKTTCNQEEIRGFFRQIADLNGELKRSNEEIAKLKAEKERANMNFLLQITDMEKQLADKMDLENRLIQAEFEVKSKKGLEDEIGNLRSQLEKKFRNEIKMRSRVAESEAALSRERTQIFAAKRELKEQGERLKKRDRQCQELCEKFGKLDAAYTKQTKSLLEKTETIDFQKKRLKFYEGNFSNKYSSTHTEDRTVGSKL